MNKKDFAEIKDILSKCSENINSRENTFIIRKNAFVSQTPGFTKLAFDTRRIDQETEYNPRRGLQNYHRSAAFITEATSQKLKNFDKLRKVLHSLKEEFGKQPEWQDSYARVLLSSLDKGLRTEQNDGDFSESQPALGSLDYIEELLYVRYRLNLDNIMQLSEKQLRKVILDKDEELTKRDVNHVEITKADISNKGYDDLLSKLFDGARATAENPSVKRSVTITIEDSFVDKK